MERKKTLKKIIRYLMWGISWAILLSPTPIALFFSFDPYEPHPIIIEGVITDKNETVREDDIDIFTEKEYYLCLNGTVEYKVHKTIYEFFNRGDYFYITRGETFSKDGKTWYFFALPHPDPDPYSTDIFKLLFGESVFWIITWITIVLIIILGLYMFIRIGIPLIRRKIIRNFENKYEERKGKEGEKAKKQSIKESHTKIQKNNLIGWLFFILMAISLLFGGIYNHYGNLPKNDCAPLCIYEIRKFFSIYMFLFGLGWLFFILGFICIGDRKEKLNKKKRRGKKKNGQ